MPCHDGGVPYPPSEEELLERKVPAMLCAIWRAVTPAERLNILRKVNWPESGLSPDEFVRWWDQHEKRDASRRAHEAERKRRAELKASAIAKLSRAERRALGLE